LCCSADFVATAVVENEWLVQCKPGVLLPMLMFWVVRLHHASVQMHAGVHCGEVLLVFVVQHQQTSVIGAGKT
jgi:hypothetical protein